MDTRFWGPDGWLLLHSIAAYYPDQPTVDDKALYVKFFETIQDVLPCIYCRNSFAQYNLELDLKSYLDDSRSLSNWLFQMHNKVNDKLEGQGLPVSRNDNFDEIYKYYRRYVREVNPLNLPGWDFIYCIFFNFPLARDGAKLTKRRYESYRDFIELLPYVTPFKMFSSVLKVHLKQLTIKDYMSRSGLKRWVYLLEQRYCRAIKIECPKFRDRCYSIELFRAGCNGKNDPKPTCHI